MKRSEEGLAAVACHAGVGRPAVGSGVRCAKRWRAGAVSLGASLVVVLYTSLASVASAAPPSGPAAPSAEELAKVQAALASGAFTEAIAQLELWSDRGIVHPDLSFDRGVAYLGRAESPARRRADLGQAAAAFEEALALDAEDEEAATILERIRATISGRAKHEGDGVVARPRLLRALLELIGENVWAGLALVGAVGLSAGLAARFWAPGARARLSGGIAAVVGGVLLVLGGGMARAGMRLRTNAASAVVVVEEARLLDAEGRPFSGARAASTLGESATRAPEGTLVHISGARGALLEVEWGDASAWLNARDVRRLATPP